MHRSDLSYFFPILFILILSGCAHTTPHQPTPTVQTLSKLKSTPVIISAQTQITLPTQSIPSQTSSTWSKARLTWFYKPPAASLDDLPNDYDFFILTHNDETARDHLKSLGVKSPILQYLLMNEIMDPVHVMLARITTKSHSNPVIIAGSKSIIRIGFSQGPVEKF